MQGRAGEWTTVAMQTEQQAMPGKAVIAYMVILLEHFVAQQWAPRSDCRGSIRRRMIHADELVEIGVETPCFKSGGVCDGI